MAFSTDFFRICLEERLDALCLPGAYTSRDPGRRSNFSKKSHSLARRITPFYWGDPTGRLGHKGSMVQFR